MEFVREDLQALHLSYSLSRKERDGKAQRSAIEAQWKAPDLPMGQDVMNERKIFTGSLQSLVFSKVLFIAG